MTIGVADIERWDPGALRDVARAATARALCAEETAAGLAVLPVVAGWDGVAAEAARRALEPIRAGVESHAGQARAVAAAAALAADRIERLKSDLRALRDDAGGPGPDVTDRLRAVLDEAERIDADLAEAIAAAGDTAPAPDRPGQPHDGWAAGDRRRWWESLSPAERDRQITADPERIGNLDGVPAADRDRANRAVLAADISGARGAARRTNALAVADGLTANRTRTGADTLLLAYQPVRFGGQGRAVVAIGDPDTAGHTAVVVPGTGSSVASGWLSHSTDAANLFTEMVAAAGPAAGASVVAWMGYDAPDSLADPRVGAAGLARRGGELLAADVAALSATAGRPAHLTVVGHSYGATTVADAAARYGMAADDVVLLGAPGTDLARRAEDFGLRGGGRVYVGSASGDPVTWAAGLGGRLPITGLGADPAADGFGSTRFKAESPQFGWRTAEDHTRYFDVGSESLYSMGDIAAGHGSALQQHGMTAEHRGPLLGPLAARLGLPTWSDPLADPELRRAATGGHAHTGPGG